MSVFFPRSVYVYRNAFKGKLDRRYSILNSNQRCFFQRTGSHTGLILISLHQCYRNLVRSVFQSCFLPKSFKGKLLERHL